jgi:hypothetical protein
MNVQLLCVFSLNAIIDISSLPMMSPGYANGSCSLSYTAFPSLDWFSLHVAEFQSWFANIETVAMGDVYITDIHRQLGPSVVVRLLFYPYFDRRGHSFYLWIELRKLL